MLFGSKNRLTNLRGPHLIAVVRDTVEVLAIIAAGVWAFYVFAYENRIKPSMANPDVNVTAAIQRIGERNGLIAVGLHVQLRNIGTVRAHFLGIAVNVYGQRIVESASHTSARPYPLRYEFEGFYRTGPRVPVYAYAYVTQLGDVSTQEDTALDPGTTIDNYRTFYVPQRRFDLLLVGIDAPYTKFEDSVIPTRLVVKPLGDVRVATQLSSRVEQYNITPVTSLDVR